MIFVSISGKKAAKMGKEFSIEVKLHFTKIISVTFKSVLKCLQKEKGLLESQASKAVSLFETSDRLLSISKRAATVKIQMLPLLFGLL